MFPVAENVFVLRSKISALAMALPPSSCPPVNSTFPFFSRVAVCKQRAALILPLAAGLRKRAGVRIEQLRFVQGTRCEDTSRDEDLPIAE